MQISKKAFLYIDGGARGNPGPAGVGVVIYDDKKKRVGEFSQFLGVATNNIAEYYALLHGLQEVINMGFEEVVVHTDSELLAKQVKGEFRVKNPDIKRLFVLALHMLKGFSKYSVSQIKRESNKEADKLVNQAINLSALC